MTEEESGWRLCMIHYDIMSWQLEFELCIILVYNLAALLSSRFSTSFAYYGLAMDLQKFGVNIYLMQVIFGVVDFPAKLVALVMLSYLGRRLTQATCLLASATVIFTNIFIPKGETQVQCVYFSLYSGKQFRNRQKKLSSSTVRDADSEDDAGSAGERLHLCLLHLCVPIHWRTLSYSHQVRL